MTIFKTSFLALAAALLLPACASTYETEQRATADQARKLSELALKHEAAFHGCVERYAAINVKARSAASEIADAAVAHCDPDHLAYVSARERYHSANDSLGARSIDQLSRIYERAKDKARLDGLLLIDTGIRNATAKLVEYRQ